MSFTYGSNIGFSSGGATYDGIGQFNASATPGAEFTRRIQLPNIQKVFLLTVTARQWLTSVETISGKWVKFAVAGPVKAVYINNGEQSLLPAPFKEASANTGTFWYEESEGKVYFTPHDDLFAWDLNGVRNWTADLEFKFATTPKTFRDAFWQPRLMQTPTLSLRIEPRWSTRGSTSQTGGGKAVLNNGDGYFDDKDADSIQWDAGLAVLEMGIDLPGVGDAGEMAEADYLKIGTWTIESTDRGDTAFTLNLKEIKRKLANQIPHLTFNKDEYPNIPLDNIGKPIPLAWGKVYGAKPVLIDQAAKRFKVASHPVKSFEGVRVQLDEIWTNVNFATTDLQLAEFTLGDEWTGGEAVSVDFQGRKKPDGSLMTNCADVVADILDYVGETNFDDASFTESHRLLKIGRNRYGHEVNTMAPSLYVASQTSAEDVVARINEIAASSLFVDFDGNWRYVVFNPAQGKTLANVAGSLPRTFTEKQIIGELRKTIDNRNVTSKVLVKYAKREQDGWFETHEQDLERNRLLHNLPPQFLAGETESGVEPALSERKDAMQWAQRYLATEAQPLVKYYLTVPWSGFFLLPTDKIRVQYERNGFDSVLEVLEVNYDLVGGNLKLVCGNQRGFGDTFGFWEADDTPDWDTGWTNAEVTQARQDQGFWTSAHHTGDGSVTRELDMATEGDPRSHWPGRWF